MPGPHRWAERSRTALLLGAMLVAVVLLLNGVADMKEIRLENASALDFNDVCFAGECFGDLPAGETSEYRRVELPLRYGVLRMTAGGRDLTGQTLSFGATRFRYRIDIVDLNAGQLAIEVIRE